MCSVLTFSTGLFNDNMLRVYYICMYKYPCSRSTLQSLSLVLLVQPDLQRGLPASRSDGLGSIGKSFISGEAGLQEGNFLEGKSP